ncbi:MAG TPA: NADPH-dependent oxidoreductase [Clostridia bacterium]|nr:NADPH-dependent oxidoreductase [Clostridia bacterium]
MNYTIQKQLNHRTIRAWKDKAVEADILNTLFDVANRTASSVGMQSYSIIRVTDPEKRDRISKVCNQAYVKDVPELLIFLVDIFRNSQIAMEQGQSSPNKSTMDKFFQGFTDGAIACQNLVNAAESFGLGTVYFGSILNDPEVVIDVLGLPKLTFPVIGLGIGYPDEDPQLKPRMDIDLKVFENEYIIRDNYLKAIKEYDREMKTYYDLRDVSKPLDEFSKQVVSFLGGDNPKRSRILDIIEKQGFILKR